LQELSGRERLTEHNTQLTRLFQPLRPTRNSVNPEADLGSTAPECWCTSKPRWKFDWQPDVAKQACYHAVGMKHPDAPDISRSNSVAKE
jgi:hypothetical protein